MGGAGGPEPPGKTLMGKGFSGVQPKRVLEAILELGIRSRSDRYASRMCSTREGLDVATNQY